MTARMIPVCATLAAAQPLLVPVCLGTGDIHVGMRIGVNAVPPLGLRVTIASVTPLGSAVAVLDLAQLSTLQDELDRATAELTTALSAAGAS